MGDSIAVDAEKLAGADLSDFNLHRALLAGADLTRSTMTGTILRNACLDGATMIEANLIGAALMLALVRSANLQRANLTDAGLNMAKFQASDLTSANLTNADVGRTSFEGACLKRAVMKCRRLEMAILRDATFDVDTEWPEGFDPMAAGAILIN